MHEPAGEIEENRDANWVQDDEDDGVDGREGMHGLAHQCVIVPEKAPVSKQEVMRGNE